jgi:thiamine-monophosphate kinase
VKVRELGEQGLIDLLAKMVSEARDKQTISWQELVIGIGDDAAAWHCDNQIGLATTDGLMQGVHFSPGTATWRELGWKVLAISLSDIAAMGGSPRYALISLGLPDNTEVEDVAQLYRGVIELGQQFGVAVAGGDTDGAPVIILNSTVFGTSLGSERILTRSSARAGELIAVTGYLGAAAAGLEMLEKKLSLSSKTSASLRRAFLKPYPRVAEGQLLVSLGVKTAIDISDGLVADLGHVCRASRVGARVEVDMVPVHPVVKDNFVNRSLEMALSGGEDYELLFTASQEVIEQVRKQASCPITVIGEVLADKEKGITLVDKQGKPFRLAKTGWQHFTLSSAK